MSWGLSLPPTYNAVPLGVGEVGVPGVAAQEPAVGGKVPC